MIDLGNCYFHCDECKIVEDLDRRLEIPEEYGGFQPEYCSCDKTGHKFYLGGYCPDALSVKENKHMTGKRKTGKAYRRKMNRLKIDRAIEKSEYSRNRTAWVPIEMVDGEWVDGNHLQHASRSNRRRYYKKLSNRKIRRSFCSGKGSNYKRHFDYWWEID